MDPPPGKPGSERAGSLKSEAIVVASHLNSFNHALLTRKDIIDFANKRGLSWIRIPEDGECTAV